MSEESPPPPLDESLYHLSPDEKAFFQKTTGIHDDEELKRHILDVQKKAYAIFPYPCIRILSFLRLTVTELDGYKQLLKLGRERPDAILLDMACFFGHVFRKAIVDGFPVQNVVGSDLHSQFMDLGHELFRTTPETLPITFIPGDIFDPAHLDAVPPFTVTHPPTQPRPNLPSHALTSLNPLRGHVSAIHASAFFHLFTADQQRAIAHKVAALLAPQPGSVIFGDHMGLRAPGFFVNDEAPGWRIFCHSPESWAQLWDGEVFEKGTVRVQVDLGPLPFVVSDGAGGLRKTEFTFLRWSVTRL
ncbi:hypothetical protein DENSPDRAFT_882696 [Dentipellis sp. KUC8613]|nr:hypothetical protein DENSPDRAFT_882696 [Dentipellis sp. KUC8613]